MRGYTEGADGWEERIGKRNVERSVRVSSKGGGADGGCVRLPPLRREGEAVRTRSMSLNQREADGERWMDREREMCFDYGVRYGCLSPREKSMMSS